MRESFEFGVEFASIETNNPLSIVMRTFEAQLSPPNQACSAKNDFIVRALANARRAFLRHQLLSRSRHLHVG